MSEGHYSRMRGRPRWRAVRGVTAGLVSVVAAAAFLATEGGAQAVPQPRPVQAAGVVPQGVVPDGTLPSGTTLHFDVILSPRNPAELTRYADEVSTPGSPLFRHYLTAGQFPSMFGPTAATISSVYAALRARRLNPGAIDADHLSIPVTATAGQVDRALGAGMARYSLAGGRVGYANTAALKLPATVAGDIEAVIGLDNLTQQQPLLTAPTQASGSRSGQPAVPAVPASGPKPCQAELNAQAAFHSTHGTFVSYNYSEFAFAYEFGGLYSSHDFGRGVKIGIVEFGEPDSGSDIAKFQKCYGTHARVSYIHVDGFNRKGPGQGEAALDIETMIGLAPDASVVVYQAPNTNKGVYDDFRTIVRRDKVRVVSISYGQCEYFQDRKAVKAITTLFKQAAVQGQTIVASSGDSGAQGCRVPGGILNRLSVDFPASDPYVLGVGGTSIFKLRRRPGEVVWNDGYDGDGAGGGGKSTFFAEPRYQHSFKINSKVREVPDVSADGDPETGYMIFHNGKWGDIGGTSASAPLWAALLALTDARCPRFPVGWANSSIYYAALFRHVEVYTINDITAHQQFPDNVSNNYIHFTGAHNYLVRKGYDAATGLGSPIGLVLARTLCSLDKKKG